MDEPTAPPGPGEPAPPPTTASFQKDCYRESFPLAMGMPESSVPKEVQFYCYTSWEHGTFESVQRAVDKHGFDMKAALVRSVPEVKRAALEKALEGASYGATLGPEDFFLVWRVRMQLPLLHALRPDASQEERNAASKSMTPDDIELATRVAADIDWSLPAEKNPSPRGVTPMTLAEAAVLIANM